MGPDRTGQQHERAEDDPDVDADVRAQVVGLVTAQQVARREERADAEEEVRRQRHGHVDVEDPLREPLVGVVRNPVEDEREREGREDRREEKGQYLEKATICGHYSVMTCS